MIALKNKYTIILTVIIAAGFLLRLVGFQFEYLFNSISDETSQNSCILRMIQNRTLNSNGCPSQYPALFTLIHLPSVLTGLFFLLLKTDFNLEILKQIIAVFPLSTMPFIRIFSVIVGTAQIFLIYKITQSLFNSRVKGLIAAGFMAVSLLSVQLSHWGRVWTFSMFFTFLALYSAIWIYRSGRRKDYILSAIFTSSTIGMHYAGFFSIIFIFFGHFFRKIKKLFRSDKNLYLGIILTLFFGGFWIFLNRTGVYNTLFGSERFLSYYSGRMNIGQNFLNALIFLKHFLVFDPVIFLLFLLALFINFKKLFTFEYLLLISFFSFYLFGMAFLNVGTHIRWSLPLMVIPIPIVADLLGDFKIKLKSSVVYLILIVSLLLPSFIFSAAWDYILTLPSTRFAAKDWIEKNLPSDSKILFLEETSILAVSQEGARNLNAASAGILPPNPRFSYLAEPNPRYLYLAAEGQRVFPGYQVVTLWQFLANRSYFEAQTFDYYILSYSDESEYQERIGLMPDPKTLELVHEIMPFNKKGQKSFDPEEDSPRDYLKIIKDIKMAGPSIKIYKKITM